MHQCDYKCHNTDPDLQSGGQFTSTSLGTIWEMQSWVTRHGGVVTRLDLYTDMKPFFKAHPQSVYSGPARTAQLTGESHAILLIGYDNDQEFWIAKNSWGTGFAEHGFFRIGFGVAAAGSPGYSYGLQWHPPLGVGLYWQKSKALVPAPTHPNCHHYPVTSTDFVARVAAWFDLPIQKVLLDNANVIGDLDAPLSGKVLLLCGISPERLQPPSKLRLVEQQEQAALLAFKAAIDPGDWVLKSWEPGQPHCKGWKGVECERGRVASISLNGPCHEAGVPCTGPPLKGTLPSATGPLASLTALRRIGLDENDLVGTLPADWYLLSSMADIQLNNNRLNGTLPPAWGRIRSVSGVNLGWNALSGPLPKEWGAMSKLAGLWLGWNQFEGTLPPEWGGMVALGRLWLGPNPGIRGTVPASYAKWKNLNSAALWRTGLTGCLPAAWYKGNMFYPSPSSDWHGDVWEGTTIVNCQG